MRQNRLGEMSQSERQHEQNKALDELVSKIPGVKGALLTLVDDHDKGSTSGTPGFDLEYASATALYQRRQQTAGPVMAARDDKGLNHKILTKMIADLCGHFTDATDVGVFVVSNDPQDGKCPVLFTTNIPPEPMAAILAATLGTIRNPDGTFREVDFIKPEDN